MISKVSLITAIIGAALAFAVPANSAPGCPAQRGACQPVGVRPLDQRPRSESVRPTVKPLLHTNSQGQTTWRAGDHIME
jgi:hypothetical protein